MEKLEIYLRHSNRILLPVPNQAEEKASVSQLGTFLSNILDLNYTFSEKAIEQMQLLSTEQLQEFYAEFLPTLKSLRGADKDFNPMYPNFPAQVMEAGEAELFVNAIVHYVLGWLPVYDKDQRPLLLAREHPKPIVLELGNEAGFRQICTKLLAAKSSLSENDKAVVQWFFQNYKNEAATFLPTPEQLTFKENVALAATCLLKYTSYNAVEIIGRYIKTATDVLRLAVGMSGGDVSLAKPSKFRQFSRPERRLLLALLDAQSNASEDVLRYPEQWKRLGERLHPGEMQNKYPKAYAAIQLAREPKTKTFTTYRSRVETLLATLHAANQPKDALRLPVNRSSKLAQQLETAVRALPEEKQADLLADVGSESGQSQKLAANSVNIEGFLKLLASRPGEFARRLDYVLRLVPTEKQEIVLASFSSVADQVATPVLLQVLTHFKYRASSEIRAVFPKGNVAKVQALENELPIIADAICNQVVEICRTALITRFKALPPLGQVWINPELANYTVPFSQRSANKSLHTVSRGSRLPLGEGSTVRFFLWWKEGTVAGKYTDRVDIDLSAVIYSADWQYQSHLSYTNLREAKYQAAHSGDIVSAPDGACEFIDLDIESMLKRGGRYVVMMVNSFTRQPFITIPECFAGWMMRSQPKSGEIFEPATVQNKVDIASDTIICLPAILDLLERKAIWADIGLKAAPRWNSFESNKHSTGLMLKAIATMHKPDLYELFSLHAKARGTLVSEPEQADFKFDVASGEVTPFDIDIVRAVYLA